MISSSVYSLPASLWAEAPKVLALMMRLPAAAYRAWMLSMSAGSVMFSSSGGPQFQARSLQHGAHAAIQQDGIGLVKQFIRLHR